MSANLYLDCGAYLSTIVDKFSPNLCKLAAASDAGENSLKTAPKLFCISHNFMLSQIEVQRLNLDNKGSNQEKITGLSRHFPPNFRVIAYFRVIFWDLEDPPQNSQIIR